MREIARPLFVARTGEYLGVLRSPLLSGSGSFFRRDGSIGHVFMASNGMALYALDDRLTYERVVTVSAENVRRLADRARASTVDRVERPA